MRLYKKSIQLFHFMVGNFHYIGLVLVVGLMLRAHFATQSAGKTLSESVTQQELLRNALWANLMMQRATVLSLSYSVQGDAQLFERSIGIVESIPNFVRVNHSSGIEDESQKLILEKTGELAEILKKMAKNPGPARVLPSSDLRHQLLKQVEKIGTTLNQAESSEWYKLLEQNTQLIDDFKSRQKQAYFLYFIFGFYLICLGWVSSRKKRAEAQLISTEAKLIEASKLSALGEMAGGIAHEVNNPLATIHLLSSQLQEVIQDEVIDRDEVVRIASKIEYTTQRISRIVKGLRFLSRDGTNDPAEKTNIKKIFVEVLDLCSEKFKNHGISIGLNEISPTLEIECRATQIAQVLLNLMNNSHDAISALPQRWIEISVHEKPESIEVEVTDSGSGIPLEVQKKLFQPFFTTKEIGKGTGLGLSISQGIIQSHGGKFALDTNCKNTRFLITLPKVQSSVR